MLNNKESGWLLKKCKLVSNHSRCTWLHR